MNETNTQQQNILSTTNVTQLSSIQEEQLMDTNYQKFPLENLSALGVAFEPLFLGIQNIINGGEGGSGIYFVNTNGKHMFKYKNGSGYLGALKTEAGAVGGGQAVITKLPCNPTMIFMAAALMNVNKKLDDIEKAQKEILEYLETKEKAKIIGDINVLSDIMNNYKFNWNNEKYKTNKHILVQDIRKDAEQNIVFCREEIQRKLSKRGLIHTDQEINGLLKKLQEELKKYQRALYLYSYSSFLEIMLLENFDEPFLESTSRQIETYAFQYHELYSDCCKQAASLSEVSVQSKAVKGLAVVGKGVGNMLGRVSVVNKIQVNEGLVSVGEKLEKISSKKTRKTLEKMSKNLDNCAFLFSENIRTINKMYNHPTEILFDEKNIYLIEGQVSY